MRTNVALPTCLDPSMRKPRSMRALQTGDIETGKSLPFSVLQGSTKSLLELQNLLLKFSRCADNCDKLKEATFVDKSYAVNK